MKSFLGLVILLCVIQLNIAAQASAVFIAPEGAIHGYDPVAYFTEGKAVKGDKQFTYQWNNATWYFSSQRTLDSFAVSPEKYAPQFGGYCAYGMADGHKAPTEPDAWTI
ncbi:MAG TPA: YHS domain-containing (seleno)protein, partial [Chitinophagaceae bacterium]|nr:YHS domain-containing (seleno)protein [Chitinophagaceae bacterium]